MRGLIWFALLILLQGCNSTAMVTRDAPRATPHHDTAVVDQVLLTRLYRQHDQWQGTPYRIGGQSRAGIDCSGFVQLTYRSRLGVALPRTTEQQLLAGQPVGLPELATGDLVFFKIDGDTRHVGIYLEGNRFLHASKSSGVMISSLDSPYWRAVYWTSRRVL